MHPNEVSKSISILGGSGFIGTRLAELLTGQGKSLRICDIRQSQGFPHLWTRCDISALDQIREAIRGTDTIVNLAAEHRDDVRPVSRYFETNVTGAESVCVAARQEGIEKIVFTSSVAVYGFHKGAVDEHGPFSPYNEYGRTKLAAEQVYRKWAEEDPRRILVIIRPTVVFGEGNRGNVFNLIHQIASGRFRMVGKGDNVKSLAYVGNLTAFIVHTLHLGPGAHVFNYSDRPDMMTREIVEHIRKCLGYSDNLRSIPKAMAMGGGHLFDCLALVSGKTFPISALRIRKFCEPTQFSSNRALESGFVPPHTLAEGLANTIRFDFPSIRSRNLSPTTKTRNSTDVPPFSAR